MINTVKGVIYGAAILVAGQAASEDIKLDDGTTCTVVEGRTSSGNMSTTVTAGNGKVSSSSATGAGSSTAASSSSASSAGAGSVDSYSTASVTRPDGTVITKRSDGTCSVTKPNK
ncbi:hypothetical protein CO653_32075 [Rhizobium anhuiense]|uniref:Uncharacterized protein n=1 Tax=Rhizobium anhuiense TaxID=1184720 RepID=A0A3S0SF36_9HYPH|nr:MULTISPECIES: hypothetical protein [Rhizobium]MBB4218778.1 hypothetical protein [Rhizobium sp. BK212]PDS34301.1 hypothetical protein CO665_31860 [Rhizobium anhuiense]PDS61623.1 hypothetical protein CO653_32075 [Rhizobium anhuiense]RUM04504.1 hypothetical protein EEQ99_02940 [Rhizobium anhuiense]GGD76373.1 hypothetical protein GCM10008012_20330 [Rhizobium anhuiense]